MSKVKDREYLALTAMLRAREAKMLDRDRMERMLGAADFGDAAKLLTDCGYEDMSGLSPAHIDEVLGAHKLAIYEEISRLDSSLKICWIICKTVAHGKSVDCPRLTTSPSR